MQQSKAKLVGNYDHEYTSSTPSNKYSPARMLVRFAGRSLSCIYLFESNMWPELLRLTHPNSIGQETTIKFVSMFLAHCVDTYASAIPDMNIYGTNFVCELLALDGEVTNRNREFSLVNIKIMNNGDPIRSSGDEPHTLRLLHWIY